MQRLDPATRNIAIGRLQAGESQNEVARTLSVNQSTISMIWNRFQQTAMNFKSTFFSYTFRYRLRMLIIEKLTVHTSEDKLKKSQFITVQHTSGHVKVSTVYDHHARPTLLCTSSA
jgi:transcriptional regulator